MPRLIRLACLATLLITGICPGQYETIGPTDVMTAIGTVEINARPEFLQMTIQVEGRSSELPQAAEELKRRVEVARKKLSELGANEESVIVGSPHLQGSNAPAQAQQMQVMMQQYGGGRRGKQMLEQTVSVSITQTITARWRLPASEELQRLLETKQLTQKIRDADVASLGDQQPVSAAQEELAVEMAAMMDEYSYREEKTKTGEPEFRFVARISAKQYQESLAAAFDKAARKLKTLADATKTEVANPVPIRSSIGSTTADEYYGRSPAPGPREDPDSGDYELIADDPNEAKCFVSVTAICKPK